ncbi:MAG TPA: type IV secretion system protein [Sulfuricella sp.]|nr:type IV secretion system protein [Sulfuricella sp.]
MKKTAVSFALVASMLAGTAVHAAGAGIPTFDIANYINQGLSLDNDVQKIKALQYQVDSWKRQIEMTTGSRGMGARAAMVAVRDLPGSWNSILQQVQSTTGSYGQMVNSIITSNAGLTPDQVNRMSPGMKDILMRTRNLGAMQKAMADQTTDVAGRQLMEIQGLTDQIDQANDPKAIADLNAALNAKKLELENTRIKLSAMDQQIQAEQKLIAQRQHEIALSRVGTSDTARVTVKR